MATNGGRAQVNLNFVTQSGEYPFLNHLKTGSKWDNIDGSVGGPQPDNLDSNGYPLTIPGAGDGSTGFTCSFDIPSNEDVPWSVLGAGQYVVKTDGTGSISVSGLGTVSVSGTNDRHVFIPNTALPNFRIITTNPADRVRNVRICHINDEASLDAGNVFGVKFKQRLAEGNFKTIRFLNWGIGNISNLTKWADRTPVGYAFYGGSHFICDGTTTYNAATNYYVGTSTPTGDEFPITTDGSSAPVDRQVIHFRAGGNGATTAMTVNLNGTGAVAVKTMYGTAPLGSSNEIVNTKRIATIIYDAKLGVWLKFGGDLTNFSYGIGCGVPYELRIQLCNEMGADLWDVPPFLTTYKNSAPFVGDFWQSYATLWQSTANAGLILNAEVAPNECWNNVFYGTAYADGIANAQWAIAFGRHEYVGRCASINAQQLSTVFGADRTKYNAIVGVQQGDTPSGSDSRLESTKYVADGGSAASNWVTHISPASYVGATYSDTEEIAAAYSYSLADTATQASIVDLFVRSSYASGSGGRFPSGCPAKLAMYQGWLAWAQAINAGIGLKFYEGAWSPDYFTSDSNASLNLISGTNTAPLITAVTKAASAKLTFGATSCVPAVGMTLYMSTVTPFVGMTDLNPLVITAATKANPCVITVTGNAATATGRSVFITGVSGMTQLNNNTYTVTGVSGQDITLSLDSSAFGTWTSGGAVRPIYNVTAVSGQDVTIDINSTGFGTYTSGGQAVYRDSMTLRNALRAASKSAPALTGVEQLNMANCLLAGGTEPSLFQLGGLSPTNNVWSALETIYQTPNPPKWEAFRLFALRLRRKILTATP